MKAIKNRSVSIILSIIVLIAGAALADVVELSPQYKRASAVTGYQYTEVIASGKKGNDIRVFPMGLDGTRITCLIMAGAGSGYFEFTTSSDAEVVAQTAQYHMWPEGDNTGTTWDTLTSQVTGLRGVSSSGEVTIEITY
ncbi:MAG: hypothetical protein GY941_23685 [Planctomycetes bacterium]|nr:hypothetical protein [Planctomycetota bacterium]